MHTPKYSLFYDFHTSPLHPDVGSKFDAEKFTDRILECGVDFLTFHARCNMGMAYYNTRIGTRHPSLKRDLFGELAEACARKGIALSAYFNGGLSRDEAIKHRDWSVILPDGRTYREPFERAFSMLMCFNSPYRDHLIAMALEVAEKYKVKGFFFDCMMMNIPSLACICPICVGRMLEKGIDIHDIDAVVEFRTSSALSFANDLSSALRKVNPEYLLYHNGIPYEDQKDSGNYLDFECVPGRNGGYDYMNLMPHYMRPLGKVGLLMIGRFNNWGNFGSLRPKNAIKAELLFGLASGLRPNIGDHFLPDCSINEAVFALVREVYSELQQLDNWFDSAVTEAEIAIVCPRKNLTVELPLQGVLRMLSELRYQFDIVTLASSWEKYKVLIFPDSVRFDEDISSRVAGHLAAGKKIIASDISGLNSANEFPPAWGVKYSGACPFRPAYFKSIAPELSEGLPDMPLMIFADGAEVAALSGTRTLAGLIKPAVNFGWDGLYPECYTPPYEDAGAPFITCSEQVAYFSHRIFTGYGSQAPVQLRTLFGNVLKQILPDPVLKINKVPSFLRAVVTTQPGRINIHFLANIPEKRGENAEVIEDELVVPEFEFEVRNDKFGTAQVYLAPSRRMLQFKEDGNYFRIRVPQFSGYALVCVKKSD